MDYIPPERPALIAQARDEDRRHVGKIINTGQIDQMIQFDDFDNLNSYEERDRIYKQGLKPGQYFPLCKAEGNELTFYVQEHKPCSVPTFEAFRALTKLSSVRPEGPFLSQKQVATISEMLGDKQNKSKYDLNVSVKEVGGRKVLEVTTISRQKPTIIGSAYYVVSDPKTRVIEEVGFKGARKDDKYWLDEAGSMFASVKFKKEKASRDAGGK